MRTPVKRNKCITHLKKLCSRWYYPGKSLPPLEKLSEKLNVSIPTVRKAIQILEEENYIENCGISGFVVSSRPHYSKLQSMIKEAGRDIMIANLLLNGGKLFGKYILQVKEDKVRSINIINRISKLTKISELKEIINNPPNILQVKSSKSLVTYNKKSSLLEIAQVYNRHRNEL